MMRKHRIKMNIGTSLVMPTEEHNDAAADDVELRPPLSETSAQPFAS